MSRSRLREDRLELHRHIAGQMRIARGRAGMTQTAAAQAIGVSYQQYNKYELGTNRISAVTLQCLADVFGTPVSWFFAFRGAAADPEQTRPSARLVRMFNEIKDDGDQAILLDFAARLAARRQRMPTRRVNRAASGSPGGRTGLHILLVDDDVDARTLTRAVLDDAGYEVTTASDGDAALQCLARDGMFDAFITDYAMPGLSGPALIELALEMRPSLPVMVVTGYAHEQTLERLPKSVKILSKPFSRHLLLAYVDGLVQPRRRDLEPTREHRV